MESFKHIQSKENSKMNLMFPSHNCNDHQLMATFVLFYIHIYICPSPHWIMLKQIQSKGKGQQIFLQENSFLTKSLGHLEFVQCACIAYLNNKTKKKSKQKARRQRNP